MKMKEKIAAMKLKDVEDEICTLAQISIDTMSEELNCQGTVWRLDDWMYVVTLSCSSFAFTFRIDIGKGLDIGGLADTLYYATATRYKDAATDYIASYCELDMCDVEKLTTHLTAETVARIVSEL